MSKHERIFNKAAQSVFSSHEGELVLAYLKECYIKPSSIGESPELTYYKLGQKELIQSLIDTLKEPDRLDDIEIYNNLSDDL